MGWRLWTGGHDTFVAGELLGSFTVSGRMGTRKDTLNILSFEI